jgi:molecular chaperone DnaK
MVRKELAELRNQAETLLYTTEAALEGYQDLVDGEMIDKTKECCQRLRTLLDTQGDLTSIRSNYQDLEALTFKIAESLYGTNA